MAELVHTLSHRIARYLEKRGLLERDAENSWLTLESEDEDTLTQLHGHSVTYRIATGPQQGRKVLTLQTVPAAGEAPTPAAQVALEVGYFIILVSDLIF